MNDPLGAPTEVTIVAVGGQEYLGVDSACVAALDLSTMPRPGTVAASVPFTGASHVEGASIAYEDVTVLSLAR